MNRRLLLVHTFVRAVPDALRSSPLSAAILASVLHVSFAAAFSVTLERTPPRDPILSEGLPAAPSDTGPMRLQPGQGEQAGDPGPRLEPASAEAHLTRGVELYTLEKYAAAITEFETVLREVPDHTEARRYLALARLRHRQSTLPVGLAEPDERDAPAIAHAFLRRGTRCLSEGDPGCAVTLLREAIRLDPSLIDAHVQLGLALALKGDLDGAIDAYRAALQREPTRGLVRVQLATALMAKEDWTTAAHELEEVIRLQPDLWQAHIALGELRYATGDIPGAISGYRQALALNPSLPDAHARVGLLLKLHGHDQEAFGELRAAAEGGVPTAQYFVARAYATGDGTARDPEEALRWYVRAAEQGHADARDAVSQWRAAALGTRPSAIDGATAREAFAGYRQSLRQEWLGHAGSDDDEPVGVTLLTQGWTDQAVQVLIMEARALSEPAFVRLEQLYDTGIPDELTPYDPRILRYFKETAAEGDPRPRRALARIYARGLGVPRDAKRATALLKGDSHETARRLLQELVETAP